MLNKILRLLGIRRGIKSVADIMAPMASIREQLGSAKAAREAAIKERQEAMDKLLKANLHDVEENDLTDAQIELMERMIAKRKEPTL